MSRRRFNKREVMIRLGEFEHIFKAGNPLAAHEAIGHCQKYGLAPPPWLAAAFQQMFIDFYDKNVFGKKGRGNNLLGPYLTTIKQYVWKRAYFSIRSWLKNPNNYKAMPRSLILRWYDKKIEWGPGNMDDALRLAHDSLEETVFSARMSTIRHALYIKLPETTTFGEFEAEITLGLRCEDGIFGPPKGRPPRHIQKLLKKHPL